jgi:phytoene desaturase
MMVKRESRKIAIVGGGIGGLTAALLLSYRGHKVTVLEKGSRLGGRMAYESEKGFKIDQGPTIVLLPGMIRGALQAAGVDPNLFEFQQVDPLYRIQFEDGRTLTKWTDKRRMADEIERMFPGEGGSFLNYMEVMQERFNMGYKQFLSKDFVKKRDFWTPGNVRSLVKLKAYSSVRQDVARFFHASRLREAYSFQTLYIGGNPEATPALYSLIPFSEHAHGIWYVKGGYAGMIGKLAQLLEERGVEVRLNTAVEQVLVRDGECYGIRTKGVSWAFDQVVLNGDFPMTRALLGEQRGRGWGKAKAYEPSSGCFLMYLGLNRVYEQASVHQFFFKDRFAAMLKDVFVSKIVPEDPCLYTFHPSLIDSSLAPPGKGVLYVLVPVPSGDGGAWETMREAFADRILEELERRGFPGLREAVEWRKVRTPHEAKQEGLYQGGSFGLAPTLRQSGVFRPQLQPYGIKRLFAVGASIHPGGGVPIVMQGARLLAEFMERQRENMH